MAGFGQGLAHALTAGVTGYGQGEEENRRALFVLAAQRRAEARQKQQDELQRIGALTAAANAGMDVTPADTGRVAPAGAPTGGPPATPAPDAGPSGPPLGTINGMQVRVPAGGVVGKAARDDAAKQSQRTADLVRRAGPLNAKLPDGHPYKLTDEQLQSIAADPSLYNEWAKGALGITKDPIATHKANRDYDRTHPLPSTASTDPSWQILQTDEGTFERNPKTGQTRPVRDPQGNPMMPRAARGVLKQVAENTEQLQAIDNAIAQVKAHPNALGLSKAGPDWLNQRIDKPGVGTRAALANVGSMVVHDRSGASVTVSESKRLNPFIPRETDSPSAALEKLGQLRALLQTETDALSGGSAHTKAPQGGTDVQSLKAKYGLE